MLWILAWYLGWKARHTRKISLQEPDEESHETDSPFSEWEARLVSWRKIKLHHKLSSALLTLTVIFTIVGILNSYYREGHLRPNKHMLGGLGFILAVSTNASLVPWFSENELVRLLHVAVGLAALAFLALQQYTGFRMVAKDLLDMKIR